MIRYCYQLTPAISDTLPSRSAYWLYAAVLALLPEKAARKLHDGFGGSFSQFLYTDSESKKSLWIVNLLSEETAAAFLPILTEKLTLSLPQETVTGQLQEKLSLPDSESFLRYTRQRKVRQLTFPVPAAFKQDGHYVSLPREELIMKNLLRKWNAVFPEAAIAQVPQVVLGEYRLHSTSFPLKGVQIPGFCGEITLIPAKGQEEAADLLLGFARFSGIGIKTALGMGGVL